MHPEADALLDAIFAAPDDDTPRLVYADWLQEHGQEDYAQFIRLSIKADRGAKSLADRTRLREERFPYWQRIVSCREDAVRSIPVQIHHFRRGVCSQVVVRAEDLVRTATSWWPAITPPRLEVYAANGLEREVIAAVSEYLPWVRELRCDNRRSADDHDNEWHTPLSGHLLAALTADRLPKVTSLVTIGVFPDFDTLTAFAESELVLRLKKFHAWICAPDVDFCGTIHEMYKMRPDGIRVAIQSFVERHRNTTVQ